MARAGLIWVTWAAVVWGSLWAICPAVGASPADQSDIKSPSQAAGCGVMSLTASFILSFR